MSSTTRSAVAYWIKTAYHGKRKQFRVGKWEFKIIEEILSVYRMTSDASRVGSRIGQDDRETKAVESSMSLCR